MEKVRGWYGASISQVCPVLLFEFVFEKKGVKKSFSFALLDIASEDIVKAAAEAGISERTVQNAKRNMGGILGARRVGGQWYNFIKKKQPPEPAS